MQKAARIVIAAAALFLASAPFARAQQPPASPQPAARSADEPRQIEAALIYRNLRLEQRIGHAEALAVLQRAGYPTDRIVEIH